MSTGRAARRREAGRRAGSAARAGALERSDGVQGAAQQWRCHPGAADADDVQFLVVVPRTIFDENEGHFYDQIAWFTGSGRVPQLSMSFTGRAGGVDFVPHVVTGLSKTELSWQLTDHYPLWVELALH